MKKHIPKPKNVKYCTVLRPVWRIDRGQQTVVQALFLQPPHRFALPAVVPAPA